MRVLDRLAVDFLGQKRCGRLPLTAVVVDQFPVLLSGFGCAGQAREVNLRPGCERGDGYAEAPVVTRPCTGYVGMARAADQTLALFGQTRIVVREGDVARTLVGRKCVLGGRVAGQALEELLVVAHVVGGEVPLDGSCEVPHLLGRVLRHGDGLGDGLQSGGLHAEVERPGACGALVLLDGAYGHLDGLSGGSLQGRYRVPALIRGYRGLPVVGALHGEGYACIARCGVGGKREAVAGKSRDVEAGGVTGLLLDGNRLDGLTLGLDGDVTRAGLGRLVFAHAQKRLVVGKSRARNRGDAVRERCAVVGARTGRAARR